MSSRPARLDLDFGPPKLELNGILVQQGGNGELGELWRGVSSLGEGSGAAEKRINVLTDKLTTVNTKIEGNAVVSSVKQFKDANPELISSAMSMAGQLNDAKAFKQTLSKFAESSQMIVKGLDVVQQLHPFIGIVVLAFKAAIQLELTRRQNDAKVLALKGLMIDMMQVLLDLQNIKDMQKVQPDGTTVEGRMQRVVQAAEKDIRDCSAVCETYMHKKFIVKLFAGPRWETKLAAFSGVFTARKDEFRFALSIHTAQGVDDVQRTMVGVDAQLRSTSQETSMLLLFRELESPKERELRQYIKEHGGPQACLDNEKYFKELQARAKDVRDYTASKGSFKPTADVSMQGLVTAIKDEMRTNIDQSLERDRKAFDRKFDAVQDRINELRNVVKRSSDRIVTAINAGPHDRIVDQDLHTIWKDMAWRGSVKARHFIIAVQDYFYQKYNQEDQELADAMQEALNAASNPVSPSVALSPVSDVTDSPLPSAIMTGAIQARMAHRELQDRWAIDYISLARVRSVLEAFDDDASGWISVKEANAFTSARPLDYSVIKWLAYWAAAFRIVSVRYAQNIQQTRARMLELSHQVLPCNRARVEKYLSEYGLVSVDCLTRGVLEGWDDNAEDVSIMVHFEDFVKSEEARLAKGLERFAFDLDAYNSLQVIIGTGRIERHILPLMHLVLKRHADIIQLACKLPLDDLELFEAVRTLNTFSSAITTRVEALESNFRNQRLNLDEQFSYAYDGMFSAVYKFQTRGTIEAYDFPNEYPRCDDDAAKEPSPEILKHGIVSLAVPDNHYNETILPDKCNGLWVGRSNNVLTGSDPDVFDGFLATRLTLHEGGEVSGQGADSVGEFSISGTLTPSPDDTQPEKIVFTRQYISGSQETFHYECIVEPDPTTGVTRTLRGEWGPHPEAGETFHSVGHFYLDSAPLLAAQHRPPTAEFEANAARARWKLALGAVEAQVRQRLWSWSYFRERRDIRKTVVDTAKRTLCANEPERFVRVWAEDGTDYSVLLTDLEMRLSLEDAAFYRFLAEREIKTECYHDNALCDSCGESIVGGRNRCLVCRMDDNITNSFELCDGCAEKDLDVPEEGFSHRASHNAYKSLRTLSLREITTINKITKQAVVTAADKFLQVEAGPVRCFACEREVSRPCWYCAECSDVDVLLCNACEAKQLVLSMQGSAAQQRPPHHWWHVLVKVHKPAESEPDPPEDELKTRLAALEQRFAEHESAMHARLDAIERQLGTQVNPVQQVENALAARMTTLEGLLWRLIQKG